MHANRLLVVATTLLAAVGGQAVASPPPPPIHLHSRTIQPPAAPQPDVRAVVDLVASRAGAADGARAHLVIQLASAPDPALRAELAARGVELQGYLPEHAYVAAVAPGAAVERLLRELPLTYIGALEVTDKVAPLIRELGRVPAHARLAGGRAALYIEFHRDVPLARGLAVVVHDLGARVAARLDALGGAVVLVGADDWQRLAALEIVKWVEPASPHFAGLNDGVRAAVGIEQLAEPPLAPTGAGVNVLVYDGGMVCDYHGDLLGRVVRAEAGPTTTHATHVAGTIGGNGAQSGGLRRGMAPAAGLISYQYESCDPLCLYNNPQDLAENYEEGMELHGADFASNSIGANVSTNGYDCACEGDYEHTARLIDAIARGALGRPFASFWAAGNERGGAARCGGGYFTTGVPATAKSSIVVGATYSDADSIADFSSFGPVDDGRMRPDVVAPGCQLGGDGGVASTRSCTGYTVLCGTSMATPVVAGAAALVLERLRARSPAPLGQPLPSTYKAILAASAVDLGNPGPDYRYGYGRIDVPAAIALADSGWVEEAEIANGGLESRAFSVPPGTTVLRAALAWDDVPGEPLSAVNLVNDLDLELIGPDAIRHRAYVLDPAAPSAPPARGANRRDPSELVEVAAPAAGEWVLEVRAHAVVEGPQRFSLAVNVFDRAPAAAGAGEASAAAAPASGTAALVLHQNVPNPFNPSTTIAFELARGAAPATLRVYDAGGRQVRVLAAGRLAAGTHRVEWDGRDERGLPVASGIYLCELEYVLERGRQRQVRRMVLVR